MKTFIPSFFFLLALFLSAGASSMADPKPTPSNCGSNKVKNHRQHHHQRLAQKGKESVKDEVSKKQKDWVILSDFHFDFSSRFATFRQHSKTSTSFQSQPTSSSPASSSSSEDSESSSDDSPTSTDQSLSSEESSVLSLINSQRSSHSSPPLSWNSTLSQSSSDWASRCQFKHSGGRGYGENLYASYSSSSSSKGPTFSDAEKSWYGENKGYDYGEGGFSGSTGHFTQIVWKNTKSFGCAKKACNGKLGMGGGGGQDWIIVCQYYPAGNVLGQFDQNVLSS